MTVTPIPRHKSKLAWSVKEQSAFGTALVKTDLTKHIKLMNPPIIKETPDFWSDKEMVGKDHHFESQRGRNKQMVNVAIDSFPVPVDFLGYVLALFFGNVTDAVVQADTVYSHTSILDTLDNVSQAKVTSLAIYEDAVDQLIQDIAVESFTLKGDGANRLELACGLIGSKIGTPLSTYDWPTAAALRFLYNFAGIFTLDGSDYKAQIRSFELSGQAGIDKDLAYQKVASEANRIYPSTWPYTEARTIGLKLSILAATGTSLSNPASYRGKSRFHASLPNCRSTRYHKNRE